MCLAAKGYPVHPPFCIVQVHLPSLGIHRVSKVSILEQEWTDQFVPCRPQQSLIRMSFGLTRNMSRSSHSLGGEVWSSIDQGAGRQAVAPA